MFSQEAELVGCKVLNTVIAYFMVCTYFWTLCEGSNSNKNSRCRLYHLISFPPFHVGVYLFVVLIVTFVSESRVLAGLSTLGWGVPAVLVGLYALCRGLSTSQADHEQ